MNINRRNLFKFGVLSGTAATIPVWLRKILPPPIGLKEVAPKIQGEEKWLPVVCGKCNAGCGLLVRAIDEPSGRRVVGVKGNPNHPVSQGTACPKGFTVVQELYHPDRLKTPLKRRGPRGSGEWEQISWDEAIKEIASQLDQIRRTSPHSLAILLGPTSGLLKLLFHRFADSFGTPNIFETNWGMGEGLIDAVKAMIGTDVVYDLERTGFVISFGADWLQAFTSPVEMSRAYGILRRGRPDRRVRIVQVEPRLSISGIKADEWIAVKPYTEAALALGMAHVIIKENIYDHNFVEKHTFGFNDWKDEQGNSHTGFKTLVLQSYAPSKVSEITGVPVETIVRLAREFATNKPSIALGDRTRFYDQMAILSLNALVGNLGVDGGILTPWELPEPSLPPLPEDEISKQRELQKRIDKSGEFFPIATSVAEALPDVLVDSPPYPIKALILHRANPLFNSPELGRWHLALREIPFIVSMNSFMDETSEFADIVLPLSLPMESWWDTVTHTLRGVPVVSVNRPVLPPLYDTLHAGDILIRLSKAIGGNVADAFPWESYEEALRESLKSLFETGKGETIAPPPEEEEEWLEESKVKTLEKWFKDIAATGGWTDRELDKRIPPLRFSTPSGKFEFYSLTLQRKLGEKADDLACLPHFEHPDFWGKLGEKVQLWIKQNEGQRRGEPNRLFHLLLYTPLVFSEGEGAHLPYLQGLAGSHVNERSWSSWVEIHPETAKELGIKNGDWVWVESPIGRIKAKARVYPGLLPNVACMPLGLGHSAYGRWAKGAGTNPASIAVKVLDEVSGHPLWNLTLVKIYKAEEVI